MAKQYRIKKVIDGNGDVSFYPQYKGWFFWHTFTDWAGYRILRHTERGAKEHIDKEKLMEERARLAARKTTLFIKYP